MDGGDFFIVPDFETGYSGFYFWHNIGDNNIAYDRLIEKCGNQLQQTRGKIIHFFTKLLIFSFWHSNHLPIFWIYATILCNSLGICHILPSRYGDIIHNMQFKNSICLHFELMSTRSINFVGPWPSDDFSEFMSLRFIV